MRSRFMEGVVARWTRLASSPRFAAVRARHPRLWSFVAARFARGEYLGLHLTVGLLLCVGALWLFGGITESVVGHEALTRLDLQVATWLRTHATPAGDRIAVAFSLVGSPATMAALAVVVAVVLAVRRRWLVLGAWLATFAGGGVLDWALKLAVHRPRPEGAAAWLHGQTFSFPSGHAMGSLFGYGMLAYLLVSLWAERRRTKVAIVVATALLVLAIGLSRLYLVVHYVSDVLGGFAAGTVWLATCISGLNLVLGHRGLAPWQVGLERRKTVRVEG